MPGPYIGVCDLTGQSFLILVGGRPKVPIKYYLILEKINWKREVLRLPAVGCKAARLDFAGLLPTELLGIVGLAG